jgi:hypothetical protein
MDVLMVLLAPGFNGMACLPSSSGPLSGRMAIATGRSDWLSIHQRDLPRPQRNPPQSPSFPLWIWPSIASAGCCPDTTSSLWGSPQGRFTVSFNLWRMTWNSWLKACAAYPMNVVKSTLGRFALMTQVFTWQRSKNVMFSASTVWSHCCGVWGLEAQGKWREDPGNLFL